MVGLTDGACPAGESQSPHSQRSHSEAPPSVPMTMRRRELDIDLNAPPPPDHVQPGEYRMHDSRRLAVHSQEQDGSESVGDEETTGRKPETRFSKRKARSQHRQDDRDRFMSRMVLLTLQGFADGFCVDFLLLQLEVLIGVCIADGGAADSLCVSFCQATLALQPRIGSKFHTPSSHVCFLQEAATKQEDHSSHAALDSVSTQLFGMPNGEVAAQDEGVAPMAVEEQVLVRARMSYASDLYLRRGHCR